jgi:dienelactone hydrolase
MPQKTPLNADIHDRIDRDDYTIEKVFFASFPGHYVSGNLYRPKGKSGKMPAVLSPHGHWNNGRFLWQPDESCRKELELGAEKTMEGAHSPLQARCAMLARMGCVVFHYDMIGYADSQKITHRIGFADAESILRLQSFIGMQTWNSIRALDFITSLPDVDPQRIAVTGASGGGTQTFILCAVDPRPAVAFPAVMVSEDMQGGCVCENAPLLRINTNNAEIASLFAPKPLGMSAANDWTQHLEARGLPEIKSIYQLFGKPQNAIAKHFSFEHNYNQVSREMMYTFFNEHLKLGYPSPVQEKPFVPATPQELSVYSQAHPLPADATDAAGLRRNLTSASDQQIAELAKDSAQYVKTVRIALRAMLNGDVPAGDDLAISRPSGPQMIGSARLETGVIRRLSEPGQVPFAALFPTDWQGTVVIWVDPAGKAVLLKDNKPIAFAQQLLDAHIAVISPDVLLTGENLNADGKATPPPVHKDYGGFTFGYNRALAADRVHDILSTIALVRGWRGVKSVRLAGSAAAGPWVLLAKAVAGDKVDRAAVDLNQFDFDQVTKSTDEMMIPGALKYGGIYGFVPLCTTGQTLIHNARKTSKWELASKVPGVSLETTRRESGAVMQWLMEKK